MRHIHVMTRRNPAAAQVEQLFTLLSIISAIIGIAQGVKSLLGAGA